MRKERRGKEKTTWRRKRQRKRRNQASSSLGCTLNSTTAERDGRKHQSIAFNPEICWI